LAPPNIAGGAQDWQHGGGCQRFPNTSPKCAAQRAALSLLDAMRSRLKYNDKTVYQALELAERAYEIHRLPYQSGLSNLGAFPPGRFEWFCEETREHSVDQIARFSTGSKKAIAGC
jgi:hypothetical protein